MMIRKETLENWYNQLSKTGIDSVSLHQIRSEMEKALVSEETDHLSSAITSLIEGEDFTWREEKGIFLTNHIPVLNDGTILHKIWEPKIHEVVYVKKHNDNRESILVPAIILDGQYEVNGRISNFWTWQYINEDMTLGDTVSDYGNFYDFHTEHNIKVELKLKIFS